MWSGLLWSSNSYYDYFRDRDEIFINLDLVSARATLFALFIVIFLSVTVVINEIQITMMTQRSEYALHCIVNFYIYINNIYNDII